MSLAIWISLCRRRTFCMNTRLQLIIAPLVRSLLTRVSKMHGAIGKRMNVPGQVGSQTNTTTRDTLMVLTLTYDNEMERKLLSLVNRAS